MRKKKLQRRKPELPFSLCLIRGAIGKEFVIKHYSYGAIRTKYPDMTNIVPSVKQQACRELFSRAHAYAKKIMADPVQKAALQKKSHRPHRVYNELIGEFMKREKTAKARAVEGAEQLIGRALRKKGIEGKGRVSKSQGLIIN